jgi:hypothetical protein
MQQVTEENLIIFKHPQKVFTTYKVPLTVVADMINEANARVVSQEKEFLGAASYKAVKKLSLSPTVSFFAARRHSYKTKVYVVRVHYTIANDTGSNKKIAVVVSHAEAVDEKDYQPVLPL